MCAILLDLPDGARIIHAAETLHRKTDLKAWRRAVGPRAVDLLLLGVEPGEERAALTAARAIEARDILCFSPHANTRAHLGVAEHQRVDWSVLAAAGVQRACPGLPRSVRPGDARRSRP